MSIIRYSRLSAAIVLLACPATATAWPGPASSFDWAAYPEACPGLYANPAAFSFLEGLRLRAGVAADDEAIERIDLLEFTAPGAGFAIWDGGSVRRYSAALSSGFSGGPVSAGASWSWFDSDSGPVDGADVFTAGMLVRPVSWAGVGAFYSTCPDLDEDLAGAGLALRPAGGLLTATVDVRTDPGFDDVRLSGGIEAVPVPGLAIRGSLDEDGFTAGLGVELGRMSTAAYGRFSEEPEFEAGRAEFVFSGSSMDNLLGSGGRFVRIETGKSGELPERSFLGPRRRSFAEEMLLLERMIGDRSVEGLILDTGDGVGNPAQAEELRSLVSEFSATGRPVYVTVENGGNGVCYVASAGRVIIHPAGEMSLTGFSSTSFFARGLLDRLGIYPDLMHIGEFKSASDMLTRSDMSEAQEIATTALLESMQEELTGAVAEGRGLEPEAVSALLEDGLFTADRAVDRGLADMVGRPSDSDDLICGDTGSRIRTVSLDEYSASIPCGRRWEPEPHVAVVIATGLIVPGESGEMFPLGRTMGSETLSDQMRRAASVPGVRALVVRIDSGGGDALASDDIHHVMADISDRIPVVVSMGGVAASGGYYMACAADVVYADAMTVTGSIGIISGKFSFGEMLEKLGVNTVQTAVSPSGGMHSSWRPYTEGERERVFLMMADGYDLFAGTVAESRGMSFQAVDSIGRGRVWSGTDALAIGLVDSIGGVADAISCAALMGGIDDRIPAVRVYPEPSSLGSLDPMTGYLGAGFGDTAGELFTEGRLLYMAPPMSIE
jgi:protease-4